MELQWELIFFTVFIAWSAGLFGTQALMVALDRPEGVRTQFISWVCSAVLLVIGGVAVFLHLQHWERIFNGFGHLSSGITQEFIAILVLAVVALVYLIFLRKSENGASVPKWLAWVAVVAAAALVLITAHSYMMAARPAWSTWLWPACIMGNALALGPVSFVVLVAFSEEGGFKSLGLMALAGTALNFVATTAYAVFLQTSASAFTEVGYYFDPTHPTGAMADIAGSVSSQAPLLWGVAVTIGALVPLVSCFVAWRKGSASNWRIWGLVALVCLLIGAIAIRVVFYNLGFSVFMFY